MSVSDSRVGALSLSDTSGGGSSSLSLMHGDPEGKGLPVAPQAPRSCAAGLPHSSPTSGLGHNGYGGGRLKMMEVVAVAENSKQAPSRGAS